LLILSCSLSSISGVALWLNAEGLAAALIFLGILTFNNSGHIFLAPSFAQEEFLRDQVVKQIQWPGL